MKVFQRFPFLLGLLASLFILLSFMIKSPGSDYNRELALLGILFAASYWIRIMRQVYVDARRNPQLKKIWFVMAVAAPFIGGLLYQIVHERNSMIEEDHQEAHPKEIAA